MLGEGTVRDVQNVFEGSRDLAYTTVMTVLDRLEKRGRVERRKQGRSFVYVPKVSRETLRRVALHDLVADFFDGSHDELREYLLSSAAATDDGQEQEPPKAMEAVLL